MEGYAAPSIAASVLQVVTFGIAILCKSKEIYNSASGTLECNVDLEIVEESLSERCTKLRDSIAPGGTGPALLEEDQAVLMLSNQTLEVSNKLRQELEHVRVKGPRSKWKSVRKALKSVMKKEEIEALNQRLVDLRSELTSHIVVGIQSKVDFNALKDSERFATVESHIQELVLYVLDLQHNISSQLDEQSKDIKSNIRTAQEAAQRTIQDIGARTSMVILSAVEGLKTAHMLDIQALMAQVTILTERMVQCQESVDSIHAQITPILALRPEQLEERPELKHRVNMWIKICTAKQLIIDALLELINLIKSRLANQEWLYRCPSLDLPSFYEMLPLAASKLSPDPGFVRALNEARCEMLFHFIEAANPQLCKNCVAADIVNLHMSRTTDLSLLSSKKDAMRFYHLIYARARLGRDWNGSPATHLESALLSALANVAYSMPFVQTHQTPLIFAVQQVGFLPQPCDGAYPNDKSRHHSSSRITQRRKDLFTIIDILIDGGANLQLRDNAGLSAYDHARILGLEPSTILKLKPTNPFIRKTIAMPRPTHPPRLRMPTIEIEPAMFSSNKPLLIELQKIRVHAPRLAVVQA